MRTVIPPKDLQSTHEKLLATTIINLELATHGHIEGSAVTRNAYKVCTHHHQTGNDAGSSIPVYGLMPYSTVKVARVHYYVGLCYAKSKRTRVCAASSLR